jgi:hypothetical protein
MSSVLAEKCHFFLMRRSRSLAQGIEDNDQQPPSSRRRLNQEDLLGTCDNDECVFPALTSFRGKNYCSIHIGEALSMENSPVIRVNPGLLSTEIRISPQQGSFASPSIGITISHPSGSHSQSMSNLPPPAQVAVSSAIGDVDLGDVRHRVHQNYRFIFDVILEVKITKSGGSVAVYPSAPLRAQSFLEMRNAIFDLAKPHIIGKWTKPQNAKAVLILIGTEPTTEKSYANFKSFVKIDRPLRKKRIAIDSWKEQEMVNDMNHDRKLSVVVWKYGTSILAADANELENASRPETTDRSNSADLSARRALALRLKEIHSANWIPTHSENWMSWANCLMMDCREKNLRVEDQIKNDPIPHCLSLFVRSGTATADVQRVSRLEQQTKTTQRMLRSLRAEALRSYNETVRILDAYDNLLQGVSEDIQGVPASLRRALSTVEGNITNQADIHHPRSPE